MGQTTTSKYDPHPSIAYAQAVVAGMKKKTGRSMEEWIEHVLAEGPATEAERRDWLKREHGLGTNYSWWVAARASGKEDDDTDPEVYLRKAPVYVAKMYDGKRASLKPIHDALIALSRSLGPDVKVCPCETIVPLYREHVFAQVRPATNSRIDFGYALKDTPATGRLIDTGGFAKKDRITHRIPITSLEEIDDEVKRWLRVAYEMDGAPGSGAKSVFKR